MLVSSVDIYTILAVAFELEPALRLNAGVIGDERMSRKCGTGQFEKQIILVSMLNLRFTE